MPEFETLPFPIRIGLVSDTHLANPARGLPADLLEGLDRCDLIFHAGDVMRRWVLEALEKIAPVHAVRGNNDHAEDVRDLPEERFYTVGPQRIGLLHGWSPSTPLRVTAREWTYDRMRGVVECAVYGHSHVPKIEERDGLLMVNPGSPTQPRWQPRPTYGILEVNDVIRPRIVEL